jgi:CYTH domain-containing protein
MALQTPSAAHNPHNPEGRMARNQIEIERKWLVEDPPNLNRRRGVRIIQGYITVSAEDAEVRLRRKDERFFETGKTGTGLQRGEIEIELSRKQFKSLWPATRGRRLEKTRYTIKWHGKSIELDVYKKTLAPVKVAEVEFKSLKEAADFTPPAWFGKEVTDDAAYKNINLAQQQEKK